MTLVTRALAAFLLSLFLAACGPQAHAERDGSARLEEAVFAGGCFWCVEHDLEKIPGVVDVVSGYTGGSTPNPTYRDHEGHYEAVLVRFDPSRVGYRELVDRFWRLVNPTDAGGQFCDRGPSYRTAIFVTAAQKPLAEASKAAIERSGALRGEVVTPILDLSSFTLAEDYHQDYAKKNPVRYRLYRTACGRDATLKRIWRRDA